MKYSILIRAVLLAVMASSAGVAFGAGSDAGAPAGDDLDRQLAQLEPIVFHPNLLPVILRNADMIGLNDTQIADLKAWRGQHARQMIEAMKQVALARINFQTAALAPTTSADALRAFQDRIFELQRKVLNYKLNCRENIVHTFTRENWENLYLVLAGEGVDIPLPAYGEVVATLGGDP